MLTNKTTMIIAAGGSSRRFGGEKNKLLCDYNNKPLIVHALETFCPVISRDRMIVAAPVDLLEQMRSVVEKYLPGNSIIWTLGGKTRVHSVIKALQAVPDDTDLLAIHDAARPLATVDLLTGLCAAAALIGGAVPGQTPVDTIKVVNADNLVTGNPVRKDLAAVATPQVFDFHRYQAAVKTLDDRIVNGEIDDPSLTDDAAIFMHGGGQVKVVFSSFPNPKITYINDLQK